MTLFSFLALFLIIAYFFDAVYTFDYYIQRKRFDYDPSSMLMYNQMYSHETWRPYQYEKSLEPEDENWEDIGSMDKRRAVTADQINSLLKNTWLGRR